jgi:nitrate/TMAO reductase-like tetraheme cytochrome c subunit
MKKFSIFFRLGMMVAGVALFTACEGPAGKDGAPGVDGVDANATCTECHNSGSVLVAKQAQYMKSQHAIGETTFENATGCAICHTSQGFIERVGTGKYATAAVIENPTAIGCRTCHNIHDTYTGEDWGLKVTSGVIMFADSTKTVDMGPANVCISCHQSRTISPNFTTGVVNDSMSIASSRWGTHHGPQAEVVAGILGQGSATSSSYGHKSIANGCVTCHMGTAVGTEGGGHTFKVVFDLEGEETLNTAGCVSCHVPGGAYEINLTKIEETQAAVQAKLTALETAFISKGWMDGTTLLWKASSSKKLKVSKADAAAMFNYKMVWEDKSLGVHNPVYINGLLDEAMTTMGVTVK